MENEVWKPVKGFEGIYEVNNKGSIKELSRTIIQKNGIKITYERMVKIYTSTKGYNIVTIYYNKLNSINSVHRIVAEAFIPNPENKRTVNHKNGIKTDNRVENLEWMTHSENHLHAFRELNRTPNSNNLKRISKFGKDHIRSKKVNQYSKSGDFIQLFYGLREAQRSTSVSQSSISNCCRGKLKTAGGYVWKFE